MLAQTQIEDSKPSITIRAILLGAIISVICSAIHGYTSINMGWSFSYGAIVIIIGYTLFHRIQGGSCRGELSFLLITTVSQMGVYQTLGLILYMLETEPLAYLPTWMAPAEEIIQTKDLSIRYWMAPIGFLAFGLLVSLVAGLIYYSILRDKLNESPKMIWPTQSANTKLIDACMEGGSSARLVAYAAAVGFTITLLQSILSFRGLDLTMIDLSHYLPKGCILVISLSVGFTSIGYLINPRTSLSLLGSGLISYLIITPALVERGLLGANGDTMALYNEYMMNYAMAPAIGILLLGGILLSVLILIRNTRKKKETTGDEVETGYLELYKELIEGLLGNRKYLAIITVIFLSLTVIAYIINPFKPLSPFFSVLFTVYCFWIAGFMEMIFITRMQGETGIGMGIASILLYETPIFTSGYRAFTGYFVYPYLRPNPWVGAGILPYYKYREETGLKWRDIIVANLTGRIPTFIFSVFLTLILWKYVGFGSQTMPAVGLIQSKVFITMLAAGNISTVLNPVTFIAGGLIGSLLEVFTPVSMMGLGMGLLFPPHYIIPFGVGGLVRLITERKYGKEFYEEKGRLIVTGLMASGLIVQVATTIIQGIL